MSLPCLRYTCYCHRTFPVWPPLVYINKAAFWISTPWPLSLQVCQTFNVAFKFLFKIICLTGWNGFLYLRKTCSDCCRNPGSGGETGTVDRTVSDGKERAYDRCLDCREQVWRIKTQVIVIIGTRVLMTVTTEETETLWHLEGWMFQEKWKEMYFFNSKRVCLICSQAVAVHKEYNIKRQWWSVTKYNYFVTVLECIFQVSVLYWSSFILSNFYFYFTTFQSIRSYFLLHYIS